jgi:K+-transporting ATPase KdpF subunit
MMFATSAVDNWVALIISAGLLVLLTLVLIFPEKF